jgi:hypothetical protein
MHIQSGHVATEYVDALGFRFGGGIYYCWGGFVATAFGKANPLKDMEKRG